MTNFMKRNPRGGDAPRYVLYALGVLVAVMAALLVKTTVIGDNGLSRSTNLTSYNPLTVAPIANQTGDTGIPVPPLAPTATDSQATALPVISWSASGLPPGITISRSTGLMIGTPHSAGTFPVTITAKDNAHPPTYGSTAFNWYIGNMAPVITQVVPQVGEGDGGIRVVITGRNFVDASDVKFGTVDAGSITVNRSGTKVVVYAPPQLAGTVDVSVTAVGGTSAPVPTDQFTYLAPTIFLVSTPTGSVNGGTRVRIAGTGLAGATSVNFGGVPSPEYTVRHKGTLLTAVAPANSARTVVITVTTPGGTTETSGSDDFNYVVVPPANKSHK
jgi:hypothetical protein